MKKILFTTLLMSVMLFGNTFNAKADDAASNNYAVINIIAVMEQSKAMQDIQNQINVYKSNLQKQVEVEQDKLKQNEQDLIKQQSNLSPNAFNDEKAKFAKKVQDTREGFEGKSDSLNKAGNDAVSQVQKKLASIISDIAKSKNYTLVYQANALAYYPNDRDITDKVVKKLNSSLTKVQVKKPF